MNKSLFHDSLTNNNRILYTPSEFAKANLIHLQEIGELVAQNPHTSSRNGLSSYLLFIVLDGSGILNYDGNTYELHKGDCVFIDCHKNYSHHTEDQLWTLKWAHFYGPNMSAIYQKYVERGGSAAFHTKHLTEYNDLLSQLYSIAASSDYIKDMKIFQLITAILTLLMEESWAPAIQTQINPTGKRNLQDLKEYLDIHFTEKITLDNLSALFYIDKYYLTRIFKEQFGMSVNQYIMQQRITLAKQLLRFTDKAIEEIAIECGIPDANYFARAFKKVEGMAPGEYRRRW